MGHLTPQLPIARALAAAGHDVAFSTYFRMAANVEAAGFTALATGPPVAKPPVKKPLLEPDREREDEVMRTVFAGRLTRERLASVPEHVEAFRPMRSCATRPISARRSPPAGSGCRSR